MPKQLTKDAVLKVIGIALCMDKVNELQTFDELGLDELDIVEMTLSLECELEYEINDKDAADWLSIADLIKYLENKNLIIK